MPALENLSIEIERSRRSFVKIGAIAASAIIVNLSQTKPAAANCGNNGKDTGNDNGNGNSCRCFLRGTMIRTADGDKKIEDLAVSDLLPTVFNGVCPIQRIERYTVKKSDPTKAWSKDSLPVRIARSALGPNVPHTDLYVTKAHALLIDDVLVTAGSLINGTTIILYDACEHGELEFFHITLACHDVVYAEGAPCETWLDSDAYTGNSARSLRRDVPVTAKEMPCAPWFSFNGGRSEIRSRFRSVISPWIDRRQKLDIIRDKLEKRGTALVRQSELVS